MHVGRVEIVLLVPGRRRQHDVGVETTRRHAEIEGDDEIELALRRRITPDDLLRLLAAHLAEVLALQPVARAEEMPQEIFVALARRAEQVRAPDEQIAREILRIVRILAGHRDRAGLQARNDMVLDARAGALRLGRERQRIDGELRRRRQPAHALRPDVEIDQAAAIGRGIGKRRQELGDVELLVAPLVAVGIEERRAVHLARRPHPVEREGEHRPAGLGPELLLADVMRPAAARDADRAAHHQQVDDAAVAHVLVVPVVHAGADDHHRAALRLLGIFGKAARDRDRLLGGNAGDRLPARLACRAGCRRSSWRKRRRDRDRARNWRRADRTRSRPQPRRRRPRSCGPARCASARRRPGRSPGNARAACRRNKGKRRPPRRRADRSG